MRIAGDKSNAGKEAMPETIILALIIAKLKKYQIKKFFTLWEFYVILAFELVYIIIQVNLFQENFFLLRYFAIFNAIYLCAYLLLIYRFRIFKSALVGAGFLFLGSVLNQIAMTANGGQMPVFPTLSYLTGYVSGNFSWTAFDSIHKMGGKAVNYFFLTDIIDLGYSVISIGDVFIRLFVFIIIYNSVKCLNKDNNIFTKKDCYSKIL